MGQIKRSENSKYFNEDGSTYYYSSEEEQFSAWIDEITGGKDYIIKQNREMFNVESISTNKMLSGIPLEPI